MRELADIETLAISGGSSGQIAMFATALTLGTLGYVYRINTNQDYLPFANRWGPPALGLSLIVGGIAEPNLFWKTVGVGIFSIGCLRLAALMAEGG
ncbi:MAG: hypothetical protein ACHQJ6_06795 [Candidatus Berkiellales bacterium]